jgi:hypothetical protein
LGTDEAKVILFIDRTLLGTGEVKVAYPFE